LRYPRSCHPPTATRHHASARNLPTQHPQNAGTDDHSAWLAAPACLAVFAAQPGGLDTVAARGHTLAAEAAARLAAAWGAQRRVLTGGCMAAVQLPPGAGPPTPEAAAALRARLHDLESIEVPIIAYDGALWARISAAPYSSLGDYEQLADAVLRAAAAGV